jgi:hypothetical protein
MRGIEGIRVSPNPVKEGASVTVKGDANGEVVVNYKGKSRRVRLDASGNATIPAPGKGDEEFTISDGKLPKSSDVTVRIVSSFGGGK